MTWDIDNFIKETEAVFASDVHTKFIGETLPNTGDELDDICNKGYEQLCRNAEKLCAGLMADK
jgi:hypothetical protein